MKLLAKLLIRIFVAVKLTNLIVDVYFTKGSWSHLLAGAALIIPVLELLRFAFETRVADLVFKGVKVGEHKEED